MAKNRNILFSIMIALSLLLVTACGGQGSQTSTSESSNSNNGNSESTEEKSNSNGEPVTLRLAHTYPEQHVIHQKGYIPFKEILEEKSNGEIKVEIFANSQLGAGHDMDKLVLDGVADIGVLVAAYFPDKLPISQAFALPAIYEDNWVGAQSLWRLVHEGPVAEEITNAGFVPLVIEAAPLPEWFTAKKKIESAEDIAGLKFRSAGGSMDHALQLSGATPVNAGLPEIYTGLERNTIDGATMNYSLATAFSVPEVTKYVTDGGGMFPIGVIAASMSIEKFNSFSKEQQQIIYEAGKEASILLADGFINDNLSKKEGLDDVGVTVVPVNDSFIDDVKAKMQPVYDSYVDVLNKRGHKGDEILQDVVNTIEESSKVSDLKQFPDYDIITK